MMRRLTLVLALLAAGAQAACAATLDVAWWKGGQLHARQLRDDGGPVTAAADGARMVPLGSLWKLFVYVHAVDSKLPTPDYTCSGRQPQEEVYCCQPGQSVGRDAALAQSCGLFFEPRRLMLDNTAWRDYWTRRLGKAAAGDTAWLLDLATLGPERRVPLRGLMKALASLPPESRGPAEPVLLRTVLGARGASTVGWFGSRLRVKTFSWQGQGGGAGWLSDGTPVWFSAPGTSVSVLRKWGSQLAQALPASVAAGDAGCVVVDYFERYPIRKLSKNGATVKPGVLSGSYQVSFENGQSLPLHTPGDLVLARDADGRLHLNGRLGLNEYVARVVDREGSSSEPEAAKALAVAARTYLQQNAGRAQGCYSIADSSATQRVSPSPATAAARSLAQWTDQLVLAGTDVRYHASTASKDTMAWSRAVALSRAGKRFDEILADAYPRAELTVEGSAGALQCVRLPEVEAWLAREQPHWEKLLRRQAGYERPASLPAVCQLTAGAPYSEQSRNRIFVRGLATREERITLAHEYIHLGLRNHPRGQDEEEVEKLARRLVDLRLEGAP